MFSNSNRKINFTEKPKGDEIGKAERTDTDKKRDRRNKKMRQRNKQREREKRAQIVEKLRPGLGNKYSKERAMQDLKDVTKSSNVTKVSVTTSSVFITNL